MNSPLSLVPVVVFLLASTLHAATLAEGTWTKNQYSIAGKWTIEENAEGTFLTFSDDFKTKKAPDLKIAFNRDSFAQLNGKNALDNAVVITDLKTYKGAYSVKLPDGFQLSDYKSVLIHCEEYSILWGGADLGIL